MAGASVSQRSRALAEALQDNVARLLVGRDKAVELCLVALLCEGHVLLEDAPGTGKTTLAKSLARSLDLRFRRLQFTPDLLPSDVTGVHYFNQRLGDFEFRPGPVLSNLLLADEINRATPRTQSALLEAMEERQVTVDGETMPLPRPFFVLATQNPVEMEGTFPLPEAQLDRFFLKVGLGYPDRGQELEMLAREGAARMPAALHEAVGAPATAGSPAELRPVAGGQDLLELQQALPQVLLGEAVRGYIVDLVQATRAYPGLRLGVSPRGALAMARASRALAALRGREYVLPDDVQELAGPVLAHRLVVGAQARLRGREAADILKEIVDGLAVPVEP